MRDSCSELIIKKLAIKSVTLVILVGILSLAYDCSYSSYQMAQVIKNGVDPVMAKFAFDSNTTTSQDLSVYITRVAGRDNGLSTIHEAERQRGVIHSTSGGGRIPISHLQKETE